MLRTRRAVHDVDAAAREAAAVQQILDALPQRGVLERREAIEERRDEAGVRPYHQLRNALPGDPAPQPPVIGMRQQPQQERDERPAEYYEDQRVFEEIADIQCGGVVVVVVV